MAARRDYYEVLGVDKGADDATIKRAFKRLAILLRETSTNGAK